MYKIAYMSRRLNIHGKPGIREELVEIVLVRSEVSNDVYQGWPYAITVVRKRHQGEHKWN